MQTPKVAASASPSSRSHEEGRRPIAAFWDHVQLLRFLGVDAPIEGGDAALG
jgi:hypothetical protein